MRRSAVVAAFLCILLVPALGFANGVPWPDWKDSDLTLWAKWNNTLGVPTEWGTNPGPLATPGLYAWPDGPGLRIDAFNYNNLNPLKKGWVLLAISIPLAAPSLYASSTYDQTVGILEDSGYLPDAQKYFYIWTFELEPNPCYERILIDFLSNATVGGGHPLRRRGLHSGVFRSPGHPVRGSHSGSYMAVRRGSAGSGGIPQEI